MASIEHEGADVVVIGGGQAGLAAGYYLRRTGLSYVILDAQERPGGAWLHGWDSLRLFSPAQGSSLPGWLFPGAPGRYPTRDEVISYLEQYEARYELPVRHPVRASAVRREGDALAVETDAGTWAARAVISATGSWQKPYVPDYPGRECYHAPGQVFTLASGVSGVCYTPELIGCVGGNCDHPWATVDTGGGRSRPAPRRRSHVALGGVGGKQQQLDEALEQQAELAAVVFDRWLDAQRQPLLTIASYTAGRLNDPSALEADLRAALLPRP